VFHALEEARVQCPGLSFKYAADDLYSGIGQTFEATPGNFRVGVLHGRNHPRYPGVDQPFGTRRGMPMMAARLQGDIGRGPTGQLARRPQGVDFGMRFAGAHVPAFADNLPVTHDHATDTRVGMGGVQTVARKLDGSGHVMGV